MISIKRLSLPIFCCLLAFAFTSTLTAATRQGQTKQPETPGQKRLPTPEEVKQKEQRAQAIINQAEEHYQKAEKLLKLGATTGAQTEVEAALKVIDDLDEDMRNEALIVEYYGKLLEKLNNQQNAATQAPPETQKYEKSELDELSSLDIDKQKLKAQALAVNHGQYDFDFEITPAVSQFISYYTEGRGRATMEHGLARSGRYRHMAEKIFKEEGVPVDLIWLAQVESVWKPLAVSSAAAKGVWQFMPYTGLQYGLQQDAWIDERSNPEKETRAAAKYLRYLSDYFAGDWLLAMAAYNTGPGRVENAIARSGYADFWEIHNRSMLLRETQNYVPAILAAIVIAKNAKTFGFNVTADPQLAYDTYQLPAQTDLRVVAELLGTTTDAIQEYNPELRRLVTPPGQYGLKLPKGTAERFTTAFAALPPEKRLRQDIIIPYSNSGRPTLVNAGYVTHRVARGETLARLAGRSGVSQSTLAKLNGIRPSAQLKPGQTIRIPRRGPGYRNHAISKRSRGKAAARRGHAVRRHR